MSFSSLSSPVKDKSSSAPSQKKNIHTPATLDGSGTGSGSDSMDSDDEFMSDAPSSQDDIMDVQASEDESLDGESFFFGFVKHLQLVRY